MSSENDMLAWSVTHERAFRMLLFVATVAVYFNSLGNGFALDDLIHISGNDAVHSLNRTLFTTPYYPGNLYRPVVLLSYALTYLGWGLAPFAYHLVNVVAHAVVVQMLFLFVRRVMPIHIAAIAAVLFAFHPLTTEVVANVSGRSEIFAALFGLGALLLLFPRNDNQRCHVLRLGLAFVCLLGAFFSKESALTFVPLFLLVVIYTREKGQRVGSSLSNSFSNVAVIVAAATCYLVLRHMVLAGVSFSGVDFVDNPLAYVAAPIRIATATVLLGFYLQLILFPYPLSGDYSYNALDPFATPLASACALIAVACVLAIALVPLNTLVGRRIQFGVRWFLIGFLITSNILFPIGTIFGERLAYLPCMGMMMVASTVLGVLPNSLSRASLTALFPIMFSVLTILRNPVWKDNDTLYAEQIEVTPLSAKTQVNYSMVLRRHGKLRESFASLKHAITIYPRYDAANFAMATLYLSTHVFSHAEDFFKRTLAYNPAHVPARLLLAKMYRAQHRDSEAQQLLEEGLHLLPDNTSLARALRVFYVAKGEIAQIKRIDTLLEKDTDGIPALLFSDSTHQTPR